MPSTPLTTHLRSWLLLATLSGLLVAVGALLGGSWVYVFAAAAVLFNLAAYWSSDKIALRASGARPLPRSEAPWLYSEVEDLARRAQLPMPSLHLIPAAQPNAFATGRNPGHSALAVTAGLLEALPREQLRGVLAHELAHIRNRDILVVSIASTIGAAISGIANVVQLSFLFGGADEEDGSPLGLLGALAAIIVGPLAAVLVQLAVSRQREYLADATAAELLGEPRPLAEALATLERQTEAIPMRVNPALEALYIANPLRPEGIAVLFSTHPPIEERIRRLLELEARRRPATLPEAP